MDMVALNGHYTGVIKECRKGMLAAECSTWATIGSTLGSIKNHRLHPVRGAAIWITSHVKNDP